MAGVAAVDSLHDRPLFRYGQGRDGGIQRTARWRWRIVGRLQKPFLENEPGGGDEFEAVVDRVAAVAAVQERVDESRVEPQIRGEREVAPKRMLLRQKGETLLDGHERGFVLLEA